MMTLRRGLAVAVCLLALPALMSAGCARKDLEKDPLLRPPQLVDPDEKDGEKKSSSVASEPNALAT